MTAVSKQSVYGYHVPMPSNWDDDDKPLSSMSALSVINNLGHLHDSHMQYRISQYGVGAEATGTTNPYTWSAYFPVTRSAKGRIPRMHLRVAAYTGSGTLSTVVRIVPASHPWPATASAGLLAEATCATTTSATGALVYDDFLDTSVQPIAPSLEVMTVLQGDGTLIGAGILNMLRCDVVMTLAGSSVGYYFGLGEIQLREYVFV